MNEYWTATSGDLSARRTPIAAPPVQATAGTRTRIVIDPADRRQPWVGAGAAITDAAASLIWRSQNPSQRRALLEELFSPEQGGLSTIRIPLGSCEPASQPYYTYDDMPAGQHDAWMSHFSLGEGEPGAPDATRDLRNIIPVVREILDINPAVKIIASPWTAPAWMKTSGSLTAGGRLRFGEWTGNGYDPRRDSFEAAYARYFVRYIDEMERYGIPIWALSIQNEPSNAAPWPAMLWTLEQQADFGHRFLRPALDEAHPDVKLFIHDDSMHALDRPVTESVTPEQAASFDGLAVHTYEGPYGNLYNACRAYPHWMLGMTERRCMMDETPADASHIMFGLIGNWLVHNGESFITLWNLALDERGLPNMIGATGRRGVVTVQHETGQVRRNLEYYMLRNFGQDVPPGSTVIGSTNHTVNGWKGGAGSVAFLTPDGGIAAHLYNPTGEPTDVAVAIGGIPGWRPVTIPAYGTVTLHRSPGALNESRPREDEAFELHPTGVGLAGDTAPGQGNAR